MISIHDLRSGHSSNLENTIKNMLWKKPSNTANFSRRNKYRYYIASYNILEAKQYVTVCNTIFKKNINLLSNFA